MSRALSEDPWVQVLEVENYQLSNYLPNGWQILQIVPSRYSKHGGGYFETKIIYVIGTTVHPDE
jgi:hypothetical protein